MNDTMTMNRVIHHAVRRDLERLESALDTFQDGDRERAEGLQRAFANLRRELTQHHEDEDRLIWPMLAKAGIDAELLGAMESEHQDMAAALADSDAAMSRLGQTATQGRRNGGARECDEDIRGHRPAPVARGA